MPGFHVSSLVALFLPWVLSLAAVRAQAALPAMPPVTASDSLLIVAPHPDDESLCCAGLIHAARQAGAKVAASVSAPWRQSASSSKSGSRRRADCSRQSRHPRRPGTNVGPTRTSGGNWLAPTCGTPAAAQLALTQRLRR